jgi:anti-sigma-K factor RskA
VGPDAHDEFRREGDLVRSLGDEPVELVDAPEGLWDRIAAAVEADAPVPSGDAEPTAPGASSNGDRARFTVHDGELADAPSTAAAGAERTHRWRTIVLGAAAAIAVLAIGAGVFAAARDEGPTEVAAAELTPFDGAQVGDAGGRVELVEDGDQVRLRVDMHDLPAPAPGTFYELWLLDPETGEPVSIATMKDGSSDVTTDIDVPPGTDTARFDVVDVSVQEESAGPEHSGDSVLRGTLST